MTIDTSILQEIHDIERNVGILAHQPATTPSEDMGRINSILERWREFCILDEKSKEADPGLRERIGNLKQLITDVYNKALIINNLTFLILPTMTEEEKINKQRIILDAIDKGYLPLVLSIIPSFSNDEGVLLDIFRHAHRQGRVEIRDEIAKVIKSMNYGCSFFPILTRCAAEGDSALFSHLVKMISPSENFQLISAADSAIASNQLDILGIILETQQDRGFLNSLLQKAMERNNLPAFQFICERANLDFRIPLHFFEFSILVTKAATERKLEFLEFLAGRGTNISINSRLMGDERDFPAFFDLIFRFFPRVAEDSGSLFSFIHTAIDMQSLDFLECFLRKIEPQQINFDWILRLASTKSPEFLAQVETLLRPFVEEFRRRREYKEVGLRTTFEEVKANPVKFLKWLAIDGFPRRIVLTDKPAVDVGGVTKEFLAVLMESLKEKGMFKLHEGLPKVTPDDHQGLDFYKDLGKVFSHLFEKNQDRTDKILLGDLFEESFFEFLKKTSLQEYNPSKAREFTYFDLATILSRINSRFEILKETLDIPDEEKSEEKIRRRKEVIGELPAEEERELVESAMEEVRSYAEPAKVFYDACSTSFREYIDLHSSKVIMEAIQGKEATSDLVLKMITVDYSRLSELEEKTAFAVQVEWIKEKIASADPEWLKKFVFAITGSPTITFGKEIKFVAQPGNNSFSIHTCFNSFDLPVPRDIDGLLSEEDFLAQIETLLDEKDYTTA